MKLLQLREFQLVTNFMEKVLRKFSSKLVLNLFLVLVNSPEIQWIQVNLFKISYFEKTLSNKRKIVRVIFFFFTPTPFWWTKFLKKIIWDLIQVSQNIIWNTYFLVIYHLGNFDNLIHSSYWVIPKITFDNICKSIQNVIIISVSSGPLNLENVEKKEKNTKNFSHLEKKSLLLIRLKHLW